ncbi:hypothetical protein T265_06468 [Opisthorchis viverrini]|uniref:Uncharacterized protein n=1 Tax=Opisthorchis viverrini TaxID=6198 RepID=A0A075ADU0_OPIVI|nr:hypothetical protein T265_06468 [Opisthorchis viverrini]KER26274.1 hypothetical protein T265_06468 [Opisthorchis viverrini]
MYINTQAPLLSVQPLTHRYTPLYTLYTLMMSHRLPLMWTVSGSPSRKTAVTSAADFVGNGLHTSLPSHCLTASDSLPPFTWLGEKSPSRKSVDWHTQHVAKPTQPVQCDQFIYRGQVTLLDWWANRSTQPRCVTGRRTRRRAFRSHHLSANMFTCSDVRNRMSPACHGGVVLTRSHRMSDGIRASCIFCTCYFGMISVKDWECICFRAALTRYLLFQVNFIFLLIKSYILNTLTLIPVYCLLEARWPKRSVVRTRPPPLDFPCLGLGDLAASQPTCNLGVGWQLGTERVLQLNDFYIFYTACLHCLSVYVCTFARHFLLVPDVFCYENIRHRADLSHCSSVHILGCLDLVIQVRPVCAGGAVVTGSPRTSDIQSSHLETANDMHSGWVLIRTKLETSALPVWCVLTTIIVPGQEEDFTVYKS